MKTQINKNFHIAEPIGKVWAAMSNPEEIVTCVPGASIIEKIDEMNYKGAVVTKFGPIKTSFTGDIEIQELDESNHKMMLNGKGLDSKGKGSAEMQMVGTLVEKDGGTDVDFNMDITIIGKLAQFGSRLINDVSDQLINQFVANFKQKLASTADPNVVVEETEDASSVVTTATETEASTTSAIEESGKDIVNNATQSVEKEVSPSSKTTSSAIPESDNSLNATSLIGTVIKSIFGSIGDFFKSLFGSK